MKQHYDVDSLNGSIKYKFRYFVCSRCKEDIPESWGICELDDDYLCPDCIRSLFFSIYRVEDMPMMPETKGGLKWSYKILGGRPQIPRKIRDKVYARDKHKCLHCGCGDKSKLSIDHIKPYSRGGEDRFENFQTLCRSCNSRKGAKYNGNLH